MNAWVLVGRPFSSLSTSPIGHTAIGGKEKHSNLFAFQQNASPLVGVWRSHVARQKNEKARVHACAPCGARTRASTGGCWWGRPPSSQPNANTTIMGGWCARALQTTFLFLLCSSACLFASFLPLGLLSSSFLTFVLLAPPLLPCLPTKQKTLKAAPFWWLWYTRRRRMHGVCAFSVCCTQYI